MPNEPENKLDVIQPDANESTPAQPETAQPEKENSNMSDKEQPVETQEQRRQLKPEDYQKILNDFLQATPEVSYLKDAIQFLINQNELAAAKLGEMAGACFDVRRKLGEAGHHYENLLAQNEKQANYLLKEIEKRNITIADLRKKLGIEVKPKLN